VLLHVKQLTAIFKKLTPLKFFNAATKILLKVMALHSQINHQEIESDSGWRVFTHALMDLHA